MVISPSRRTFRTCGRLNGNCWNCDTCRKALRRLEAEGFHDLRSDGLAEGDLAKWELGRKKPLDRRSAAWRGLAGKTGLDAARAATLTSADPAKRPAFDAGELVGFGDAQRQALNG